MTLQRFDLLSQNYRAWKLYIVLLLLGSSLGVNAQAIAPAARRQSVTTLSEPLYRMDKYPRPFIITSLNLNGAGYQPASTSFGAGVTFERRRLMLSASAGYNNAKKVNDNTANNAKGHTRSLSGHAFVRANPNWYFGGGLNWSQLSTTNYAKSGWHPEFGGGRDWLSDDFSCRGEVVYSTPGSDRTNGTQGTILRLWLPSPARNSHILFRQQVGIYRFHDTVTDPSNQPMTATQIANKHFSTFVSFGIVIR